MIMQAHILLIDDDEDDQFIFKKALGEVAPGYICRVSNSGPEGLFELKTGVSNPEIIFLDLNMPLMNGFEFLAILKNDAKFSGIPVIIFSTSDSPADKKRAREMGAINFITKTCEIRELKRDLALLINPKLYTV